MGVLVPLITIFPNRIEEGLLTQIDYNSIIHAFISNNLIMIHQANANVFSCLLLSAANNRHACISVVVIRG